MAVFARANGASGDVAPIRNAYALGVAMNDPMRRASTDQIALAVGLLLTPSVQLILDPALNPAKRSVSVLSLRATFLF